MYSIPPYLPSCNFTHSRVIVWPQMNVNRGVFDIDGYLYYEKNDDMEYEASHGLPTTAIR